MGSTNFVKSLWLPDIQVQNFLSSTLPQTHCTENPRQIFPEMKLCGIVPTFCIHVSVSDLYGIFPRQICLLYKSLTYTQKLVKRLHSFISEEYFFQNSRYSIFAVRYTISKEKTYFGRQLKKFCIFQITCYTYDSAAFVCISPSLFLNFLGLDRIFCRFGDLSV